MNKYGAEPKVLGKFVLDCPEMFFYQYLPIKMAGSREILVEERLKCFNEIIGAAACDFVSIRGLGRFDMSYIYLTAKSMYIKPGGGFNRPGWHSDGFLTDDINYVISDNHPTVFNSSDFSLTLDDRISMEEMEKQAKPINSYEYPDSFLLRLDQFNIHKCAEIKEVCVRTFVKLSFSPDKYNLRGNSHNYLIDYKWDMKERAAERNIPQSS